MTLYESPYFLLLSRNHNYRRLFTARAISLAGDWLNTIAVFVVLERLAPLASAAAFSVVLVIKMLPHFLLSPAAGVCADRFDRRLIMILSDISRAGVILLLLLVPIFPHQSLVYSVLVIQTSLSAFFEPARSALVPDIVKREELVTANALGAMTWSTMLTLGAALGGVLVELFGWQFVIVLDSLSYMFSAALLYRIRFFSGERLSSKRSKAVNARQKTSGLGEIAEVLSYLRKNPDIFSLALVKTMFGIGGGAYLVLTIFGQKIYHFGESAALGISFLYAARGIGAFCGPILGRRLTHNDKSKMKTAIAAGFFTASLCYIMLGYSSSWQWAFVFVALAHLGSSLVWVFSTVLLQFELSGEIRGRVFGMDLGGFTLTHAMSILCYGYMLNSGILQPRGAAVLIGLCWLLPGCIWLAVKEKWPENSLLAS